MNIGVRTIGLGAFGAASILAAAAPAGASPQRPFREVRCDLMDTYRGRLRTYEARDLHVLEQTAAPGRFDPAIPQGTTAVICARTSIVPAANDDEVLWLGLPLFITEPGAGRYGVLEVDGGRYRFRLIHGELTAEEQPLVDQRMAEFQTRLAQASARPQR